MSILVRPKDLCHKKRQFIYASNCYNDRKECVHCSVSWILMAHIHQNFNLFVSDDLLLSLTIDWEDMLIIERLFRLFRIDRNYFL